MSLYFADDDNLTFGVQASNVTEVAQFSSTTNDVFVHLYTNNNQTAIENTAYGVAFGSSNFTTSPSPSNDFYLGNVINNGTAVDRVLTMRNRNIGIGTSIPEATLHVVGSNLPADSNILLVQAINSPAYPAIVIDRQGYVGIGTTPTSNQAITVRGKLVVDNIQVGGSGSGGSSNSRLIVAYGMTNPADVNYLDFGYSTMSNISNIVTPIMTAENIDSTFSNVGNNSFLDHTATSISPATTNGTVAFATTFYGNSISYIYTLTTTSNSVVTPVNSTPKQTTGSVDTITRQFTPGTYQLNISASAAAGSGPGSMFIRSNIATFTVGATDLIGTPSVNLVGTPTYSSDLITYSGISYYRSGIQVTFPTNALQFGNIYQSLDPATRIPYVLSINSSNLAHSNVFTNHLVSNNRNTIPLTISVNSTSNTLVNIPATVYNINSSNVYPAFMLAFTIVGAPMSEIQLPAAQFASVPVASVTRMSTSSGTLDTTNLTVFNSNAPSAYDCLFSPLSQTFYTNYGDIQSQLGIFYPSYTQVSGSHDQFFIRLSTTSPLYSFVLLLTNSTGVSSVSVNWAAINTTWYDASVLYTNASGCAAAVTGSTTRFPIRLPLSLMNQALPDQSYIYINVTFSGSIPMYGIAISN